MFTSIDEYKKFVDGKYPLRKLTKMQSHNDGTRRLVESIMAPEVIRALADLKESYPKHKYVLIGGMAFSFYGKPRYTEDIDILISEEKPAFLLNFKNTRLHAYQHNSTHVEVEVLDADYLKISDDLVQKIFDTSIEEDGLLIASPSGIIALKLQRFNKYDQGDIEFLKNTFDIDLSIFNLSDDLLKKYDSI